MALMKLRPDKMLPERIQEMPDGELIELIEKLQAELNARIDARVEELRPQFNYNIPPAVLRNGIEGRATGCECKQFKTMVESK